MYRAIIEHKIKLILTLLKAKPYPKMTLKK